MLTTADHTYASTPEDKEAVVGLRVGDSDVERDGVEEDTTEKVCFSQYSIINTSPEKGGVLIPLKEFQNTLFWIILRHFSSVVHHILHV